jgi:hypothetical protein
MGHVRVDIQLNLVCHTFYSQPTVNCNASKRGVHKLSKDGGEPPLQRVVLRLPRPVFHQQILAERVGSDEVGLATPHFGDLLHELHEAVIRGQHERVDQHAGALALGNLFESLTRN